MNKTHNQANESKRVLTSRMIKEELFKGEPSGCLSGTLAFFMFGIVIIGFITIEEVTADLILMAIMPLIIGVVAGCISISRFRENKRMETRVLNEEYRIVKTICVDIRDYYYEADMLTTYIYTFKTGKSLELNNKRFCRVGDLVYLVYLDENHPPEAYFNGAIYYPDTDLVIEDKT